jgi:chromosome segregation ATPase
MAESKINNQVVELSTAVLDLQQIVRKLFDQIQAYKSTTKQDLTAQLQQLTNRATQLDEENRQLRADITRMNTDLLSIATQSDRIRQSRESLDSINQEMKGILNLR